MLGSVQPVLTCVPAAETVAPCPAGTAPAVTNAYLIESTSQTQLEASLGPVDFAEASVFWSIAFTTVISLWSLSWLFNVVRRAIR